jgi:transposase
MARPLRVEYAAGIAKAHCIYGYTLKEITAHFGVHYSTIGRRLHHYGASRDEPR